MTAAARQVLISRRTPRHRQLSSNCRSSKPNPWRQQLCPKESLGRTSSSDRFAEWIGRLSSPSRIPKRLQPRVCTDRCRNTGNPQSFASCTPLIAAIISFFHYKIFSFVFVVWKIVADAQLLILSMQKPKLSSTLVADFACSF